MFRPLLLTAAVALSATVPALAQQGPGPAPGQRADHEAMRAEHMKHRADDWALLLDLRPAQRPALDAWLEAGRPPMPPGPPAERPEGAAPEKASFEERLAKMEQRAGERDAAQRQHITALRTFYQGLDATQRQRFEALLRLSHGRGGFGGPESFGPPGPFGRGPDGHGPRWCDKSPPPGPRLRERN